MNYILLSGGSGKRLWPLSNEVRSKQFIKILKSSDGNIESMVQRVYRQINSVDKNANITIASSINQVPQLKNQLGNNIDISIEPMRRDTFPAIALASLYLIDKKNISLDNTVVVSPVDPYVSEEYFSKMIELDNKVKKEDINIGLIGIKPTYPSEKYGYILEKNGTVEFKEKPNLEKAKQLLKEGALWNAGVFCYKLSYIKEKIKELTGFDTYNDLYNNYGTIEKISFDYAVVEKEKNIKLVEYNGEWKDIGTWNTLTEVMTEKTIGNVIVDDKSSGTNIVNELNIPIIAMGIKDTVIAASADGIFVSAKGESSYNKPLVEKLDNRPMYEERAWGEFKVLDMYTAASSGLDNSKQAKSLVKHLYIKAGKSISYQKHNHRDEVWTIIDGEGILALNDKEKEVSIGDVITIKKGDKHALRAITDLHFVEVQIGDEIAEGDIERF